MCQVSFLPYVTLVIIFLNYHYWYLDVLVLTIWRLNLKVTKMYEWGEKIEVIIKVANMINYCNTWLFQSNATTFYSQRNDNTYCGWKRWLEMVPAGRYYLMLLGAILGLRHDLIFLFLDASFTFFFFSLLSHSRHSEHIVLIPYSHSLMSRLSIINKWTPFAEKKIRKQLPL